MELELSDDQQALQESVRAVLERECPISLVRSVVEEHKHAEELWSRMVELDWPALAVPEDDGGLGLGFVELAVVCEQLGRVLCPAPFLATATQFVPAILGGRGAPSSATGSWAPWRATAWWGPWPWPRRPGASSHRYHGHRRARR